MCIYIYSIYIYIIITIIIIYIYYIPISHPSFWSGLNPHMAHMAVADRHQLQWHDWVTDWPIGSIGNS